MRNSLLIFLFFLFTASVAFSQVTSSSVSGSVKDAKGGVLPGASVRATHVPSGTSYAAAANKDGLFNIPGMRIGGPYKIEVTYVGFNKSTYTDITLELGQPFILNAVLSDSGVQLNAVSITGTKRIVNAKSGASTNINKTALATLPSFSRSITDFTRITPQSTGTSFAGRDSRSNSITVDGANLNNTFGTSSDLLPGGGAQPISIESYDELSINISPFDVKQSGFTGAGVFATTKSGTNTFHGSAYTYYKNQSFNGTMIGDVDISAAVAKSSTQTYGFTLGGPIIKNKLFFFANAETEKTTNPGVNFSPKGGSGVGTVSATPIQDLKAVSDYLNTKYGYQTGVYDNFPAFQNKNTKVLLKLDWNINDKNKLSVKYSYLHATADQIINSSGTPNSGSYTFTGANGLPSTRANGGLPNGRFSLKSMGFENSNYGFLNKVSTGTAELNSTISPKLSNQLLLTFKNYDNPRTSKGGVFPTIDIFNGAGDNYISAGSDPNTKYNEIIDNTVSLYDNITYYAGKHTITGGINYEFQKIGNSFMPGAAGSYIYNSLDDFLNDRAPIQFTYNYSLIPGVDQVFSANLKVGTISLYAQDEYAVSDNFKITYGLRADKGLYLQDPVENPQITALQLPDALGNMTSYNTGKWPKSRILLSPRAGFRASLLEDKSLVIRGGMGIFTGRIPYVFLTNSPSNSAMYNFGGVATADQLKNIKFSPDPSVYANLFPQVAGTALQNSTVVIDQNFKFPQVFRADLGVEKNLGNGFTATFEAIYTKDINATRMRNANLKTPTGVINEGDGSRVRYVGTNGTAVQAVDRSIYPNLGSVIVLENTNEGYSSALTAQLSKNFFNGFNASIAYTYTKSKEAFSTAGSTAASVWSATSNVGTTNDVELRNSANYVPHRIVASASYKFNYLKHGATTIGLFYEGQAGSSPFSYVINGDINGDGNASSDLMYIPKRASDLKFTQYTATVNGVAYTYTPQQQAAALEQFINNSPYLSKHRGQYADRNAAFSPWYNRIDANILQDFYINTGGTKHTLQLSAVVINLPNLLSKYWGIRQFNTTNSPLTYTSIDANGVPAYNLRQFNGKLITQPYQNAASGTTWSLLIGAKYMF
ncbi:cell envelope biogenesis protein OmpA [Pedobacter sp. HMWF019]|uniref:TonB-dependent receptor n=1 Tax=Pedobacter sp. HMWF019 TaxID=2056856 RepID=UPI000D36A84E|nr:carboxypeptidase-like regulatory domain-containing protein [Pedobacter sp. HMWF019]PTS97579.1 cell envelope biogenesis protein OmpA [Pedobacter sp. HMWF019]